ncbi:hypothetical protein INS49_011884 [Diaporthe citri]|uniref:uncharacterized protein n=1 Tax=Diaporthe citri TaxID=83186 RepID=UPI001C7FF7AB|nr:uncharacterized protein INS49_011884 [Diaporthe citri]KAG6360817.1 hypothetical protein INS49_011884 [Diaporthe citri]
MLRLRFARHLTQARYHVLPSLTTPFSAPRKGRWLQTAAIQQPGRFDRQHGAPQPAPSNGRRQRPIRGKLKLAPTDLLVRKLRRRGEPLTWDAWEKTRLVARSRSARHPVVTHQLALRQDEAMMETSVSNFLQGPVEWETRFKRLAYKGIDQTDLDHWLWILEAEDTDVKVERFISTDRHKPIFVLMAILRTDEYMRKGSSLVNLYDYIARNYFRSDPMSRQDIPNGALRRSLDNAFNMMPTHFMLLIKRAVYHCLKTWPSSIVTIARLVVSYMRTIPANTKPNKTNRRTGYADQCRIFNHALCSFRRVSSLSPLGNLQHNWKAQRILLGYSAGLRRPLIISKWSYRAIRFVLLGLKKSRAERRTAVRHVHTWPPYRKRLDGTEEREDPEEWLSRSVKAGILKKQEGYTDDMLDQALDSLGGAVLQDSIIVQTRSGAPRVWSGDRRSLSVFSAWAAKVYAEMFSKLFSAEIDYTSSILPGAAKEVYPPHHVNLTEFERERLRPLSVDELYERMLRDGNRPVKHCLTLLVRNASTVEKAAHYLRDSPLDQEAVESLTKALNPTYDSVKQIPALARRNLVLRPWCSQEEDNVEALRMMLSLFDAYKMSEGLHPIPFDCLARCTRNALGEDGTAAGPAKNAQQLIATAHQTLKSTLRALTTPVQAPTQSIADSLPPLYHELSAAHIQTYLEMLARLGDVDEAVQLIEWVLLSWDQSPAILEQARDPNHKQWAMLGQAFVCFRAFAEERVSGEIMGRIEARFEELKGKGSTWLWPSDEDVEEQFIKHLILASRARMGFLVTSDPYPGLSSGLMDLDEGPMQSHQDDEAAFLEAVAEEDDFDDTDFESDFDNVQQRPQTSSRGLVIEIPRSTLIAPRSSFREAADYASVSRERTAVRSLLDSDPTQLDEDFIEFELDDFVVYIDTQRHPQEMRALHTHATLSGQQKFYLNGTLKLGDIKHRVERVPFDEIPLGNYGKDHSTVGDQLWIRSELNRGRNIYYQLKTPSIEYARFHSVFLWVADLAKHAVDFSEHLIDLGQGVSIRHFGQDFARWLQTVHGRSTAFQKWYEERGTSDFRHSIIANQLFMRKELFNMFGGRKWSGIYIFKEIANPFDTQWSTNKPDKKWYGLVQNFSMDNAKTRLRRQFDITWLYDPEDTPCCSMRYPWKNELFLSDHCTCEERERKIPEYAVVGVHTVEWFGTPQTKAEFFVRQTYQVEQRRESADGSVHPLSSTNKPKIRQGFDPKRPIRKLRALDLFSGCGNFGRGLEDGGAVEAKWVNDIWPAAIHTYMANSTDPDSVRPFLGSIDELNLRSFEGKFTDSVPQPGEAKNRSLVAAFAAAVDFHRPKYGILENVKTIVQSKGNRTEDYFSQLICAIVGMGYQAQIILGDAWSHGAPQGRVRAFLYFAAPGLELPQPPVPSHSHPRKKEYGSLGMMTNGEPYVTRSNNSTPFKYVTALEATADLPDIYDAKTDTCVAFPDHRLSVSLSSGDLNVGVKDGRGKKGRTQGLNMPTRPFAMNISRAWHHSIKDNLSGDTVKDMFDHERDAYPRDGSHRTSNLSKGWGRVHPHGLFHTVTTICQWTDARIGRLSHWDQPRPLTVMEARRAQGIPDHEVLLGTPKDQWEMVGNAVARQIAMALGLALRKAWVGTLYEEEGQAAENGFGPAEIPAANGDIHMVLDSD